ncbi:hypothetical protein FYK55_17040 [Roseiconus nitratireducens]|uniref:Uncharacterized protein n=1 Tax=Roseiconus nitratireducens TaxID=2605748 RepID=A0A5M6D6M7_9BACT|nr:hypothetical protein [Roseiconus nitratireducens]KAA5541902.1 hypothetical protein FYK55_17040 [Roseiconus nitratireducens]
MPKNETETDLRKIFAAMDADRAQEIREAYYKAMEGLYALAESLETEDAKQPETAGPLLEEHFRAVAAIDAMKGSRLGAVL